jgi:hypothetical protein
MMKGHTHSAPIITSGVLFSIIALGHLLRVVLQWEAMIGGMDIPQWVSIVFVIIAGGMATWNFKEAGCLSSMKKSEPPPPPQPM